MRGINKEKLIDIYTDYLISMQGQAIATGLSKIVEELSHDQITRFLSKKEFNSKTLWLNVKKMIREIEDEDGVIVFDDTSFLKSKVRQRFFSTANSFKKFIYKLMNKVNLKYFKQLANLCCSLI